MENNGTFEISYLYLKSYGWVPKTLTVYGESKLNQEITRLTRGVVRGDRIIRKIEKVA